MYFCAEKKDIYIAHAWDWRLFHYIRVVNLLLQEWAIKYTGQVPVNYDAYLYRSLRQNQNS